MITFKDLKAGDKFYVINEGTDIGYIRIEEYMLEEALYLYNEKTGTYYAKIKDANWPLIIHESLINDTNCGFIFTTLEEAMKLYIQKSKNIWDKLNKKYESLIEESNKIRITLKHITQNIQSVKEGNFSNIIISKQYN